MHDIDRTYMEFESDDSDMDEYEFEEEFEEEEEFYGEMEMESPFDEAEEMELAAELLEITDDEELEQFLGKLVKRAGRAAGRFLKSRTGRALKGILKGAAKKALPVVGGALGSAVGGPAGGMLGSRLARLAGRRFGLELEGLSEEDAEFEVSKGFVRFAGAAAKKAAMTPSQVPPAKAAKNAAVSAARIHAPGLLRKGTKSTSTTFGSTGRSGRWIRRGRRIILMGV